MAKGRRYQETDTTPGKVLALALLSLAPILAAAVILPLLSGGDFSKGRAYAPVILFATPLFAVLSILQFARAPKERRWHRASRIGVVLAGVALVMWVLVLVPTLRG